MRKLTLLLAFIFIHATLFAEATHNRNVTATQLATKIQGKGITITNPVITRGQIGGANSQLATFSNGIGGANLQIDEGILLTASTADQSFLPNTNNRRSQAPGGGGSGAAVLSINNVAGLPTYDADLLSTITQPFIGDQVVFEFDVTLDANTRLLLVDYQFASDEYPEWVGSQFNDAFGFFISGGDLTQTFNIARVVDDSIIVSTATIGNFPAVNINNVNRGTVGSQSSGEPTDLTNNAFFIDNGGRDNLMNPVNAAGITSEFDGFTTKLHATLDNLTPGTTYHFKMALADTWDAQWDAGVFVNKIIGVKEPSVCYSYDIRVGNDINVPSINNDIVTTAFPDEQLTMGIVIQSLEGEITLEDVNLSVIFTPNNSLKFLSAEVSPDSINTYLPVPDNFVKKIPFAQVPIGENITASGGSIGKNQVIFTKFLYDFNGSSNVNTHFELTADLKLTLNGISAPRKITTAGANPTLVRCPEQQGYFPQWAQFNVERRNSTDPLLFTQISGRPFNVDVVSYDPDAPSTLKDISDTVLELELIDASKYADSNQSLFTCREPSSVGQGQPIAFGASTNRVPAPIAIQTNDALKSAAFRLWYLADENRSIINHNCNDFTNNGCFNTLYATDFRDKIDKSPYFCDTACSTGNCYQCLKDFFARPICSRDNFSIRPASYRISIADNNESNITNAPQITVGQNDGTLPTLRLAAEYGYKLATNATLFGSDNAVNAYHAKFPNNGADLISEFQYQGGTGGNTCADTANARQGVVFRDGIIQFRTDGNTLDFNINNIFYSHNNVGQYNYHIEDNNWTIVDQRRYANKTFPDSEECISAGDNRYSVSANGNAMSGCGISSNHTNPIAGFTYNDLPLQFEPFAFGLDLVALNRRPNDKSILFMNDFRDTNFYGGTLGAKISMSTSFEGNVTALGRRGTILSNFTTGCSSSNVRLNLGRQMNPTEASLTNAPLQQFLEVGLNVVSKQFGVGTGVILPRTAFPNVGQGHAPMRLHTTLTKPYGLGNRLNPVHINYTDLNATGINALSTAQMNRNYTPDGSRVYDNNVTYVYGKVTPRLRLYNNVEPNFKDTEIYADIYCTLPEPQCPNLNLTVPSLGEQETESGWWAATIFSNTELGQNTLVVSHDSEENANPSISFNNGTLAMTLTNVPFDDNNASQEDINVSVAGAARPSTQRIVYTPPPWLIYDPANDFYRVRFIGPSTWVGVGKTGRVSETESLDESRRKMSW